MHSTRFAGSFDREIAEMCSLFAFEPDEVLIRAGECSRYLYFLAEGKLKAFMGSESGKVIPFGYFEQFRTLGEVSSLWGDTPTLTVAAVERTYCFAIDLDVHRAALLKNPSFLRYVCQLLCAQVKRLNNNMVSLMTQPVERRLAAFILQNTVDGQFQCSLLECSELIATSYRHLIRKMNSFCACGLLRKERQKYYIADEPALQALASQVFEYYD